MLSEPATDRNSPALASGTLPNRTRSNIGWLAAAFILIGLNLRPGIASLSPLLPMIETALGLSGLQMSMLTMLPVACLGLFGPFAPRLAARFGIGRSIRWLLVLLSAGLLLRVVPATATLFAGTAILGAAIGMIGVLMPVVARVGFPSRLGFMMGVYTMSLCVGAAVATGVMAPLALAIERTATAPAWSLALAFWAVPALLAMGLWWRQPATQPPAGGSARIVAVRLWRKKLAWQVTGFMAAQSSLAFVTFGWLPVILQDRGFSEVEAGGVASLSFVAQALTALLVPTLAARCRQQSLWAIGIMTAVGAGLCACMLAPVKFAPFSAVLLGLGQGGSFGLALTLIVLRTTDARIATSLSGMVQSVGSVVASLGPLLAGIMRPASGDWTHAAIAVSLIAAAAGVLGALAGRPVRITS